jgi:hypothetical protein
MRNCVLLFFTLVAMQVSAGPAWRWVDADGTVHYSDRPVPGAVEVYLPDSTSRTPRPQPSATTTPGALATSTVSVGANEQYSQLAIASPAADETLWNIEGILNVTVAVAPELRQGHRLALVYDGEQLNLQPSSGTSFTVSEVYRGLHTIQAVILDSNNAQVLSSAPVQFMVQQPSLLNPNRRN